jgi:FKBP-type peptidyl-prolyl cis-trans isomerase FkpA
MLKVGTSIHLGLIVLCLTTTPYSVMAQTTTVAPAAANTTENKREPIKELIKTDTAIGTGAEAVAGKIVTVHDTGWLFTYNPAKPDHKGSKIYSTLENGQPDNFQLGSGKKIKGFDQGIEGMKVGGKRTLIVPPEFGYGARNMGRGLIPPNSVLVYDIELIDVK